MKLHFKNRIVIMGFLSLLAINACKDDISPIYEELDYDRVFSPLEFEARIADQVFVELSWKIDENVESYELEISFDSLEFSNVIHTASVTVEQLPYVYELPAGDARFSARVKAISTDDKENSVWNQITFKSLPENLFEGYHWTMDALNAVTINWVPGKAVTAVVFDDGSDNPSTFDVTTEEAAAGSKSFTSIPNAAYQVKLLYETSVRGKRNYAMEGTVLLPSGGDLAAAIAAASAGDVIVLEEDGRYGFVGDLTIDNSLKIKGLDGRELPVLYLTSGDRMFYIGSSLTQADSLVFENLYMSGLVNFDAVVGTQHRGVFDMESEACNIGSLKFIGCKLYDMGRQIVRLRGGSDQTIGLLLIDDCIIHNLGKSSASYGVLSADQTNTNVTVIKIANSTVDSVRSHVLRYDDATACESITLENCTFNNAPYSATRYFSDTRNTVISDGFYVNNCIFGSTSYDDAPSVVGIRVADGVSLMITNSYYTSDFILSDYLDMLDQMTSLDITSDVFWTNPNTMDYSFKSDGLEAGDPRWY